MTFATFPLLSIKRDLGFLEGKVEEESSSVAATTGADAK